MKINFAPIFGPYAEAAVGRLRYLHPDCEFEVLGASIVVGGAEEGAQGRIKREVYFQLYREKIYQEGLPMRTLMYQTLLS